MEHNVALSSLSQYKIYMYIYIDTQMNDTWFHDVSDFPT